MEHKYIHPKLAKIKKEIQSIIDLFDSSKNNKLLYKSLDKLRKEQKERLKEETKEVKGGGQKDRKSNLN